MTHLWDHRATCENSLHPSPKIQVQASSAKTSRHHGLLKVKVLAAQSCLTLCDPIDCSPPDSSVHRISQAKILEWTAIPFSRRSSLPRDWTWVSHIAGRFFTTEPPENSMSYLRGNRFNQHSELQSETQNSRVYSCMIYVKRKKLWKIKEWKRT